MLRENSFFTDDQITKISDVLITEKEKIEIKEDSRERYCLDKNELSDILDEASANIQTTQDIRFRNRELFFLKKINKTLDRIEKGTFGLCDDCDDPIAFERLLARPTAELCISCKEAAEHSENNNFFLKKSKSLGKTISEIGQR